MAVARGLAVLTVAAVTLIFGTAGVLVQEHQAEDLHGTGAVVLHVTSGLLAAVTAALSYRRAVGWSLTAAAVLLFGFSFVQSSFGSGDTLNVHVPGAFLVVALSVGLAVVLLRTKVPAAR
ncbi:hypothetical protein ACIP6P_14440 [Streptomyces sp. NPDC088729]|uniref:hypothetical protein n=1 Tax=Streptomyces sp. NPDC088729 TaxID=3365876 RepID=UPI003818F8EE